MASLRLCFQADLKECDTLPGGVSNFLGHRHQAFGKQSMGVTSETETTREEMSLRRGQKITREDQLQTK